MRLVTREARACVCSFICLFLLPQEHEDKPEDCIPAEPGNEDARNFLANAPTRGLWMPLGKEVKVMQCEYCTALFHGVQSTVCSTHSHTRPCVLKF